MVPAKRSAIQHYADTSAVTSFFAACFQVLTIPIQALGSIFMAVNRYTILILVMAFLFAILLLFTGTFVYAYSSLAKVYNTGVAPVVSVFRWIFLIVDFIFRAFVPIYNGFTFWTSQLLTRTVVSFTFGNFEAFPDILQALLMTVTSCVQSLSTWLENLLTCTVRHADNKRMCGISNTDIVFEDRLKQDCHVVFAESNTQCFGAPNFFLIDLLTPGLYMRQAALSFCDDSLTNCHRESLWLGGTCFEFGTVPVLRPPVICSLTQWSEYNYIHYCWLADHDYTSM